MIRSCRSDRSLQLVRNAITPWMAPSIWDRLVTSDSNRLKVVQAFVQCVPDPYFAEVLWFSSSIQIRVGAEIDANVWLLLLVTFWCKISWLLLKLLNSEQEHNQNMVFLLQKYYGKVSFVYLWVHKWQNIALSIYPFQESVGAGVYMLLSSWFNRFLFGKSIRGRLM